MTLDRAAGQNKNNNTDSRHLEGGFNDPGTCG